MPTWCANSNGSAVVSLIHCIASFGPASVKWYVIFRFGSSPSVATIVWSSSRVYVPCQPRRAGSAVPGEEDHQRARLELECQINGLVDTQFRPLCWILASRLDRRDDLGHRNWSRAVRSIGKSGARRRSCADCRRRRAWRCSGDRHEDERGGVVQANLVRQLGGVGLGVADEMDRQLAARQHERVGDRGAVAHRDERVVARDGERPVPAVDVRTAILAEEEHQLARLELECQDDGLVVRQIRPLGRILARGLDRGDHGGCGDRRGAIGSIGKSGVGGGRGVHRRRRRGGRGCSRRCGCLRGRWGRKRRQHGDGRWRRRGSRASGWR